MFLYFISIILLENNYENYSFVIQYELLIFLSILEDPEKLHFVNMSMYFDVLLFIYLSVLLSISMEDYYSINKFVITKQHF